MVKEIIIKEIRDYVLSTKFVVAFVLSALLLLVSIYLGLNSYLEDLHEYQAAQMLEKEHINSLTEPYALQGRGLNVYKAPEILSIFTDGIQDAVGRSAHMNSFNAPQLIESKQNSKPLQSVFGYFDLVLIIKYFLSLFVILFTYNAISGEKEAGTLKAIAANQIPRYKIVVGKIIGGFISLIIPLTIPLLFAFILLTFDPRISMSGEDWLRSALILVSVVLYISVFCSLGLFVSSLTRSSAMSLFILILVWVGTVYIIPQGAVIFAEKLYPMKTVFEINANKRDTIQSISNSTNETFEKWRKENQGVSNEEFRNHYAGILQESAYKTNTAVEAIDNQNVARQRKQMLITRLIARCSPASLFHFSAMSLAGTGIEEHENFLVYLAEYQRAYSKWHIDIGKTSLLYSPSDYISPDFSTMPEFRYERENLRRTLARTVPDMASMAFMSILLFFGSIFLINRYDVR